ncbi:DUF2868 domain-containing protein [Alcaligenaceae bacterium]|nr:DUF2868 domain-containing protein [Alcaligenaceae bacterium]
MSETPQAHHAARPRFGQLWLAESLRLRETLWGPLEDTSEVRRARSEGRSFTERLILRAQYLAKREKLDQLITRWSGASRLTLAGMALIAIFAGIAAALGALGDGTRPVNVNLALAALLGLNTLTFVLWLLSFFISGGGSWLGECWLWLTRKLARGPDVALAPRALVEVLGRNSAMRWLFGTISHGLWTIALSAMLLTMATILATRRYSFNWETTLLSPDAFVTLTTVLGWLPSKLGFAMPAEDIIRVSDGLQALPPTAYAYWSSWLIGCVVVYGLVPRVIAMFVSGLMARRKLAAITLDPSLPGYAELRDRLEPFSEHTGIDSPSTPGFQAHVIHQEQPVHRPGQSVLVGIELAPDMVWPPPGFPGHVADLGIIDSRQQRKTLLEHLQACPPGRLLMVCDARQTPDRGTIALLADLGSLSDMPQVVLYTGSGQSNPTETARVGMWRQRLAAADFQPEQIQNDLRSAIEWLSDTTPVRQEPRP